MSHYVSAIALLSQSGQLATVSPAVGSSASCRSAGFAEQHNVGGDEQDAEEDKETVRTGEQEIDGPAGRYPTGQECVERRLVLCAQVQCHPEPAEDTPDEQTTTSTAGGSELWTSFLPSTTSSDYT